MVGGVAVVFLKALPALLLFVFLSGCTATTALFFYPQTVWISTPADAGLQYEDVWLTAADGTQLHSWWLPAQGSEPDSGLMVLYLHGNAENISSHSRSVYWLPASGVSVLALDYRGFGASDGRALLPSVLQDVEAAAGWMRERFPHKQLLVLGQSIGTALAVNFVSAAGERYEVKGLILDAAFTGFAPVARDAMSQSIVGWLVWPFTVLVPGEWDPRRLRIPAQIPVLMLHSPDDAVVRYSRGRALYEHWRHQQPERIAPLCWLNSRGPHIASFTQPDMRAAVREFMSSGRCPPDAGTEAVHPQDKHP